MSPYFGRFAGTGLTAGDTVSGGGTPFSGSTDTLIFTSPAAVTADMLSGVSHIEEFIFNHGNNSFALTDAEVSSSNHASSAGK